MDPFSVLLKIAYNLLLALHMCSFSVGVPFPWIQPTLGHVVFTIEKKKKIHVQVYPHSSNPCCSMSIVVRIFQKVFLQHWFP